MASSKQMDPLWFRLLCSQRAKRLTGFTPSFLIGAAFPEGWKLSEEAAFAAFTSLLIDFRDNTPSGYDVVIAECTDHRQPIAALYKGVESKPACEAVSDRYGNPRSLFAERRYFAAKEFNIDSLVTGLWNTFRGPLLSAQYSIRDKVCCPFNAAELKLISAAAK